jgi:hypothetical protein
VPLITRIQKSDERPGIEQDAVRRGHSRPTS